jgi:hypothetical protein
MRRVVIVGVLSSACTPHEPETIVVAVPETASANELIEVAEPPADGPAHELDVPPDATITLTRTRCYGTCPAYTVTLHADGSVQWRGDAFVKQEGEANGRITPEDFADVWRLASSQPFEDLPREFRDARCKSESTDHTSAIVTLEGPGVDHRVSHYYGCHGNDALDAFAAVETRIDEVTATDRWIEGTKQKDGAANR